MSPLYLYNGKLLVNNNALAISENCCCYESSSSSYEPCQVGLRAFDNSNNFYLYFYFYDYDCCFLPSGSQTPPVAGWSNDGYIKVMFNSCVSPNGSITGTVIESVRSYNDENPNWNSAVPLGAQFTLTSNANSPINFWPAKGKLQEAGPDITFPDQGINLGWETNTKQSMAVNPNCCNPNGDTVYIELETQVF